MKELNVRELNAFVNKNIVQFHEDKIKSLADLNLKYILRKKNPYLFKAKNIYVAADLIRELLEAFLSSSEEEHFGAFLEELAVFIASETSNGKKSAATGIDLEFSRKDMFYLISIKSGPNWGNSSQHKKQEADFQNAVRVLKQSKARLNVQTVLGICYGKTRTSYLRGYMKVVGQNFWYLISGNENLYKEIIEPLGYKAKEHNEEFRKQKDRMINLFSQEFMDEFCDNGSISWENLVEYNSGNLDITV